MKKILLFSKVNCFGLLFLLLLLPSKAYSQIYAPEGVKLVGTFNSWQNYPIQSALNLQLDTVGVRRYHTVLNVQVSGGDISGGSHEFKFSSGPSGSPWNNGWGNVTVDFNSIKNYAYQSGKNNSVILTNGKYYIINFQDLGYENADAIWMELSAVPCTFYGVTINFIANGSPAKININLSTPKAPEENIYVRYTIDNWNTWGIVQANGENLNYSADIPGDQVTSTNSNKYYVFTSTKALSELTSGYIIDMSTISISNRGGLNYALPVELSSFIGNVAGNKVNLDWTTATEKNNSGFEVQRSVDKTNFEKIAFLPGYGVSNSPKNYSYTDEKVNAGSKYYYRLKQIDNDGSFEYSKIVEVITSGMPHGFVLDQNYPNPFNPSTTIKFGFQNSTKASLKIYDALGTEVADLFNGTADAGRIYEVQFNGSGLSSGVYFYKLSSDVKSEIRKMLFIK